MSEQYYKESVEQTMSYNARLSAERRLRLPFIDSQTGVAQNHSQLFKHKKLRGPGNYHYSYDNLGCLICSFLFSGIHH